LKGRREGEVMGLNSSDKTQDRALSIRSNALLERDTPNKKTNKNKD